MPEAFDSQKHCGLDSVHGVGWTDTPGRGGGGGRQHSVGELDALEQRAELFRRQPRPSDSGK